MMRGTTRMRGQAAACPFANPPSVVVGTIFGCLTLALLFPTAVTGAGFVARQNFVVVVPPEPSQEAAQQYAHKLAQQANHYRDQIAQAWLGTTMPDGVGRTVINVEFTRDDDVGLTWAKDNPNRAYHNVYLKTNRQRAIGSTLAHEMVHVVLATQYPTPDRLASWVEEGIASQYDDDVRKQARTEMLRWFVQTDNWPSVDDVLNSRNISANDRQSYTVAASLTEMLVKRTDRETFVRFASDARELGWAPALRHHYRIQDTRQLARNWRQYVQRDIKGRNRDNIVPKLVAIE